MSEQVKSRDNSFKLLSKLEIYDIYVRKYIINCIPKIYNDIRIHILDENYDLIRNVKLSSITKGNIRIKHLVNTLINISMLDYLFNSLSILKVGDARKISSSLSKLTDLKNIIYVWYNREIGISEK